MAEIGKLVEVRPRAAWQHEAHDFTPWLAENLDQLGSAIGIVLEPEGTEISVGAFAADLLAKDISGRRVLVENQLETTDHGHLGQIMTYLAGLKAEIIVWVATEFRDQHVSALDWLNEHTSDEFAFFAVKLRVVQIGDSKLAPIFEVVARPNEWERSLHRAAREKTGEASSFASVRRKFWQRYLELFPEDADLGVKVSGAPTQWMRVSQDHDFNVAIYRATTGVGVFLRGVRGATAEEMQARLAPHADRFVELAGNVNKLGSASSHPSDEIDINTVDEGNWDRAIRWLHERSHAFLEAAIQVFDSSD
jgi:hypothetical protein